MKTRILNIAILALSLSAMVACKDEKKEVVPANEPVEATENAKTTAALNPVHGAAGHRCDIPVGAPLDQAASTRLQQTNTTLNPNVSPVRVQNGDTPFKNPPHGQPGHDCSKPVGADLN
jgi:hypothetical protein